MKRITLLLFACTLSLFAQPASRMTDEDAHQAHLHKSMMPDAVGSDYTAPIPFGGTITCGVIDRQNGLILVGTDSAGVFRSLDEGATWVQSDLTVPMITSLALESDGRGLLWASALDHGVYVSLDHGAHWELESGTGYNAYAGKKCRMVSTFIEDVPISNPPGATERVKFTFAGTDQGLYFYLSINNDLPVLYKASVAASVSAITPMGTDEFFCTDSGDVYWGQGPWFTQWTRRGSIGVRAAALTTDNAGSLYAAGRQGAFRSDDQGMTWRQMNAGIADTMLVSAAADRSGNVYVGSQVSGDIYKYVDRAVNWGKIATLGYSVRCLIMSRDGDSMYAAAGGRLFKTSIVTGVDPIHDKSIQPHEFLLAQNYPNPFNPSTTISFSLPSRTFVSLKIFDVIGREVSTVVSEMMAPGTYQRQWNASGMPSGVYFYRLQAGAYTETKRLVLLK